MVKNRLAQPDAVENGWLLDGYPRSGEQAEAIEQASIRPDLFLLINVGRICSSDVLVMVPSMFLCWQSTALFQDMCLAQTAHKCLVSDLLCP